MIRREFLTGAAASVMASRALADGLSGVFDPTPGGVGPLSPLGGAGLPSWLIRGPTGAVPKFQRDTANSHFWFNGKSYPTDTALNTAAGGVNSGTARVYGPYLDPTNTNLLTNGDFSNGTTGWTAFGTGGSIANIGGSPAQMELTSGGSLNGFSQSISGALGLAFKFSGFGKRGTSPNTFNLVGAINNTLTGVFSGNISSTTRTAVSVQASGSAASYFFGARNSSGAGTGTADFDTWVVLQEWPISNWTPSNIVALVEATTPTGAVVDQVIWQSDVATERDRIRLVRLVADNHIHLIVTSNNNLQADLDLGAVADATFFSIAFSCAQNSFNASLNGGVPVTDVSGVCPGVGVMQIGRSFTGDTWTGTDPFVVVF